MDEENLYAMFDWPVIGCEDCRKPILKTFLGNRCYDCRERLNDLTRKGCDSLNSVGTQRGRFEEVGPPVDYIL